ncbi:MAG: hypothetical protein GY822_23100 [Deltaproteobacteria bacterium]|nr:hypothetical protein [Deltaproteobacteria bacterium]
MTTPHDDTQHSDPSADESANLATDDQKADEKGVQENSDDKTEGFDGDVGPVATDDENTDDENTDDTNTDDANTDDANTDDANTDDANTDDANTDDANTDDENADDANADDANAAKNETQHDESWVSSLDEEMQEAWAEAVRDDLFNAQAQLLETGVEAATDIDVGIPLVLRLAAIKETKLEDSEGARLALTRWSEHLGKPELLDRARAELLERVGRGLDAKAAWVDLANSLSDDVQKATIWERVGDIALLQIEDTQDALVHYQAAFRTHRENRSAVHKAATLYLNTQREVQAKQLLDLERELLLAEGGDDDEKAKLALSYTRVAKGLISRPSSHEVARKALTSALSVAPELAEAAACLDELDAFPTTWKDHVRTLRDAALDARDKKEAAAKYLTIAEIYRAYDPENAQVDQNVDKCLLLAPGYRPALKFLELCYRDDDKVGEFIERMKKLVKVTRAVNVAVDIWLFVTVLMAELDVGNEKLAEAYEEVRKLDPRNTSAISALTELHMVAGRFEAAADVMDSFLKETADPLAKRSMLRTLARLYEVELDDKAQAKIRYEALRDLHPDDELTLHLAGMCEELEDFERAAELLEERLDTHLDDEVRQATLERLVPLYKIALQNTGGAFDAGCRLFVFTPTSALQAELMTQSAALSKESVVAEALLSAAARREEKAEARVLRLTAADTLIQAGANRRAREVLDAILEVEPNQADALQRLDRLLLQSGDPAELAESLQRRLAHAPSNDDRVNIQMLLADTYRKMRKMDDVITSLRDVLAIDAKHVEALERLDDALKQAERFPELAAVIDSRLRFAVATHAVDDVQELRWRLAKLYDERLGDGEEAAVHLIALHKNAPDDHRVLRSMERLLDRDVAQVVLAEELEPYYARVDAWRRHAQMLTIRRDHHAEQETRVELSSRLAKVLEEKLRANREAFDAWGAALVDAPSNSDILAELDRLASKSNAEARFAELLLLAAEKLPDGPPKHALLARRADLLQGPLGDRAEAEKAHLSLLDNEPDHLPSLVALSKLYLDQEHWQKAKEMLQRRLVLEGNGEKPSVHAELGRIFVAHLDDDDKAKEHLEIALFGEPSISGRARSEALAQLVQLLRGKGMEPPQSPERLVEVLQAFAETLAGKDRADARVELGDVFRVHLDKAAEALSAYEAALANAEDHIDAWVGVRALVDDENAPTKTRRQAGRTVLARAEVEQNSGIKAAVLHVLCALEEDQASKRKLVHQLAHLLVDDIDEPDEAVTLLLENLAEDPKSQLGRELVEQLAPATGKREELLDVFSALRESDDEETALLYTKRVAEISEAGIDHTRALEGALFLADKLPDDVGNWRRAKEIAERAFDKGAVAKCLEAVARLSKDKERITGFVAASDYVFSTLENAERGFALLHEMEEEFPNVDKVLARLQLRFMERQRFAELDDVMERRTKLIEQRNIRSALLLELGTLRLRSLDEPGRAVEALTASLEAERDGNSTLPVTETLQLIAKRDDEAGLLALGAILDHHRAQEAWQPLVESLEIAAEKRSAPAERASIFDEISDLQENALRVPALAFMAACRSIREQSTPERLERVKRLASVTASFSELIAVLEDAAEQEQERDPPRAIALFREIIEISAERLEDQAGQVQAAEAILQLDPADEGALSTIEGISRSGDDRDRLLAVLKRRAERSEDAVDRRRSLMEVGALLVERGEDGEAEASYRQVMHDDETGANGEAGGIAPDVLTALDALYERTGNSSGHVEVIAARVALENDSVQKAHHLVRLGLLKLTRRGDPAGATDTLTDALRNAPEDAEVKAGLESLVDHARTHGVPPIAHAASLLEYVLRAQQDWANVPRVIELKLSAETDSAARAGAMLEVAQLQEHQLGMKEVAFNTICRALKEIPEDGSMRVEAERLAKETESEEALAMVYEDLLDEVTDSELRAHFNRRIATIAENVQGDTDEARRRLHAAVQAGATDLETLQSLTRLSRVGGDVDEHAAALKHLASTARGQEAGVAKDAFAELADLEENRGDLDAAIQAANEGLEVDGEDRVALASVERLLNRAERWTELEEFLAALSTRELNDDMPADVHGGVLVRLLSVRVERLQNAPSAVEALEQINNVFPSSPPFITLGNRILAMLSMDKSEEAPLLRSRVAILLEPRHQEAGEFGEMVRNVRLQLEITTDVDERQAFWARIIDLYENTLNQPEQAFMAVGRALGEQPSDEALRERAELISARVGDMETLVGLYEDIIESSSEPTLQVSYARRCAELYETSIGDPTSGAAFYETTVELMQEQGATPQELDVILERLERLYRALGDPQKLAKSLRLRAETVVGAPGDDEYSLQEFTADQHTQKRQFLFEAATIQTQGLQDFGGAIDTLQRLLASAPNDLAALRALQAACEEQQRFTELADALQKELNIIGAGDAERVQILRFRLGEILDVHLDAHDEAMAQFQAILDEDPDHEATRIYLESRLSAAEDGTFEGARFLQESYERTGDWQKAVAVLQQQVSEFDRRGDRPKARDGLERIADIQETKLEMPELAFMTLCRALKQEPSDAGLREGLERLSRRSEVVDELCEVYEDEAVAADEAGRSSIAAELREHAAALCANDLKDIPRAIKVYENILEKQPGRALPLEKLTDLYEQIERFNDLERILRRRLMFLDEAEDRKTLLLPLAQVLADNLDRPDESLPLLAELRDIDPDHVEARRLLIELMSGTEDLAQLRALLEEELAACRESEDTTGLVNARQRLALLLSERMNELEAAIPLWEEISAHDAHDRNAFNAREKIYTECEKWESLRSLYDVELSQERNPQRISELTQKIGALLSERLGGQDEAITRHEKVLELDPQNASTLSALQSLYAKTERYEDLVSLLRRMMRFTTDPVALKKLRFSLAEVVGSELEKRAEAVETGRRILDIEPHTREELTRLANIFEKNQAFDELAGVLERHASLLDGDEKVSKLLSYAELLEEKLDRSIDSVPAYQAVLSIESLHEHAFTRLQEILEKTSEWERLVNLRRSRAQLLSHDDLDEKMALFLSIMRTQEEQLAQKEMAFLTACTAFQEDVNNDEIRGWLDRLAIDTDNADTAIDLFEDALPNLQGDERIIGVHLRMAELAWEQLTDLSQSEKHLLRVLEYDANNDDALEMLIALYEHEERWWDAVGILERKAGASADAQGRVEALRRVARMLDGKANDIDGAVNAYRRILELDGKDFVVLQDLAELLERTERFQPLIGVLERHEEIAETSSEKHSVRYRIAGIWEQQLDNYDQAIACYQSILDDDAKNQLAQTALERLFTALERPRELIELFELMLREEESSDEKVKLLGKIANLWEQTFEDVGQAIEAVERVLTIDGSHLPSIEHLERLLRHNERWERLVEVINYHISLSSDPEEIVGLYLEVGDVFHKEVGRADKGLEFYEAALDFNPGAVEAIHRMGHVYERSGNWFNALEMLAQEAQLLGASPKAVEIYFRVGKINEEMLLDLTAAKAAYDAALEIEPGHIPSLQAMKEIAKTNNDGPDAYLKWIRSEAKHTDDDFTKTELHTTAGLFLQDELGDLEGASEEFEKALAVTYDHLEAARPLAELCYRNEEWDRAEQLLDIVTARLDPNEDPIGLCKLHYKLGYICEKLGNEQKALTQYQRAYDLDSTYLPALELLGTSLSRAERWADAAKIYQAILIHHREGLTDAEIVDYYQRLATLNHNMGQNDRALKNLEKALEIDPSDAPSLRLMATVHQGEGQFEDAYDVFMDLIKLVHGEERPGLLVEVGRLAKDELEDPYRAIDAFEDANRQQAGIQEVLEALLGLYRETCQGASAVEVLEELVRLEEDEKERVRLTFMLGEVYRDELKDSSRAAQYFNATLDLDPRFLKAFEALESLLAVKKDWAGLENNYRAMIARCPADMERVKFVIWKNLGDLYRFRLKNADAASQVYTILHKQSPDDLEVLEVLAHLLDEAGRVEEAIVAYQRLLPLLGDKFQGPMHKLLGLFLNRKNHDRALCTASALYAFKDLSPDEEKLYAHFSRQQPAKAQRALTDKLWDVLLTHENCRGPLATLSEFLWRAAGPLLVRAPKDLGFDKKRAYTKLDLDAPVPTLMVTQMKYATSVLGGPGAEVYLRKGTADPLQVAAVNRPSLVVGDANEIQREMPLRQLWFLIGRQTAYLRPAFIMSRVMSPDEFQALIEATVKFVEPRYQPKAQPQWSASYLQALKRAGPQLQAQMRPAVTQLLQAGQAVDTRAYLLGVEHTALRAAHTLCQDIMLSLRLLRQPDASGRAMPVAVLQRELLLFLVSNENTDLRQRLGLSLPGA